MNTSLSQRYQRASTSRRDQLILDNVDYVARILSTMNFHLDNEDAKENLNSAGILGLVEAANGFDPNQGVAFRTYAYPRIRGAIVDELRSLSPVSQQMLNQIGIVRRCCETLESPVSPEQIAEHCELTLDQVVDALEALRFSKPEDWNDLSDLVHDSWRRGADRPEAAAELDELKETLATCIESLPERERLVVTLYHKEELNLSEIGQVLGLSESSASRILATARFRLQELIRCKIQ